MAEDSPAPEETGNNTWRRLPAWPAGCSSGCTIRPTPLYLAAGLGLSFSAPRPDQAAFDEYTSDPAKPVPFRARPIQPIGSSGNGFTWDQWLVDDQREASGRPDVAVFTSDVLMVPTKIRGEPIANLLASTSGSDSDWVVKLILGWRKSDERRPRSGTLGYLFGMKGRHKARLAPVPPSQGWEVSFGRVDLGLRLGASPQAITCWAFSPPESGRPALRFADGQ